MFDPGWVAMVWSPSPEASFPGHKQCFIEDGNHPMNVL